MDRMEMFKSIMKDTPIVAEIMYSEEMEQFIQRISIDGNVLGILTFPEEAVSAYIESTSVFDQYQNDIQVYPNEEAS